LRNASGVIGAVALVALAVVAIVSTSGHKGSGAKGPPIGSPMPAFAAPLAASKLTGDVNVTPAACNVTLVGAFVSCSAAAKGPIVIGFITTDDKECTKLQAALGALAESQADTTVVLAGLRGNRKALVKLAATQPSVTSIWDRNGTLANRYGIAVCPTVVVVRKGGEVAGSLIGSDSNEPAWLQQQVGSLLSKAP